MTQLEGVGSDLVWLGDLVKGKAPGFNKHNHGFLRF